MISRGIRMVNRSTRPAVALETTLLVHGVPASASMSLNDELAAVVRTHGACEALVGVVSGVATVGMTREELAILLSAGDIPKANTSNLGAHLFAGRHAATTVSATMELAAAAGIPLFATGGLGGVHKGYGERLDISADLAAFTRFPVAVVASGVKSILDVASTREALESLGVPVLGFGTDRFPAFYLRDSGVGVDERFDDERRLAAFLRAELARTGRGVLIAHPIAPEDELPETDWTRWLAEATDRASERGAIGRDATPELLAALHEVSGGATLRANIALVKSNARLAARLAAAL